MASRVGLGDRKILILKAIAYHDGVVERFHVAETFSVDKQRICGAKIRQNAEEDGHIHAECRQSGGAFDHEFTQKPWL
jgi:hypothetical protein